MGGNGPPASIENAIAESGLIPDRSSGVALVSGGADSAVLLTGLAAVCDPGSLVALHLNYGLRPDSSEDEGACVELCRAHGVELVVERVDLDGEGNVQAAARAARYEAAERLREARGLEWIAAGHTRTDLVETVIYRLATSPGRRALLGLRPRRGRLVRPLLAVGRGEVRAAAIECGLPFRDDPTNAEPLYARNRIRNEVLPVLAEIGPGVESAVAETQDELAEEADALEAIAAEALEAAGAGAGPVLSAEALEELHPAVRRLALRALAERVAARPVPLGRGRAAEIRRLAADPEGGVVELGGGLEARLEHGHIRFAIAEPVPSAQAQLTLPGSCRFGGWEVRAELGPVPAELASADIAALDPDALAPELLVRGWRDGDTMRPLGLGGTKSLQDLFTDRRVPRSLRRTLPVVISGQRIAWIAGVAVSEEFAAAPGTDRAAVLSATVVGTPA